MNAANMRYRAALRHARSMVVAAALGAAVIDVRADDTGTWLDEAASCLDWHAEDLDVVEGRYEAYRGMPDVRWAMGSLPLGLGMVRTVIELRWRDASAEAAASQPPGVVHTQTLFDGISASEFAGGVSFYRSEAGLHIDYPRCEWGTGVCDTASRNYRYSAGAGQFVGADPHSEDSLLHLCAPGYFALRTSGAAPADQSR